VAAPRRKWTIIASVFCAGVAVACAASAEPAGFQDPPEGARLEPGTVVRVAWSLGEIGARDFDEIELVLSLDGGRSFPLRLTRDISPDAESVRWRVPKLPSAHARLALRVGCGEREESENVRLVGGEFTILAGSNDPLEELRRVRGEWRTREAAGSSGDAVEPGFSGAVPRVHAVFPSESAALPTSSSAFLPDRGRGQALALRVAGSPGRPAESRSFRTFRALPLRQ
jgi:hypothetical protein